MTGKPTITDISCHAVRISPQTQWTFIEVTDSDGLVGVGEATVFHQDPALASYCDVWRQRLIGAKVDPKNLASADKAPTDEIDERAVFSAIELALWDIEGQRKSQSIHQLLGGAIRPSIPLYANINRGTKDRSPQGFAASAGQALKAGFDYIKIAPFDGLNEGVADEEALFRAGLDRIAAVCDACAEKAKVLIDCHWRLSENRATTLLEFAAVHGLYWVECPLPETTATLSALKRVSKQAKSLGVCLAGMEFGLSLSEFEPYIEDRIYDVLMPDVKYCGGLSSLCDIAAMAEPAGVAIAPHNPTGPVCHAASVHVSSILKNFLILEIQFNESALFYELVAGGLVPPLGQAALSENPGLGVALDHDCIARLSQSGT